MKKKKIFDKNQKKISDYFKVTKKRKFESNESDIPQKKLELSPSTEKNEQPKKALPKKHPPKKDPPKKVLAKKDPLKKVLAKKYPTNEEDPPKKDPPKKDSPKKDPPKKDPLKKVLAKKYPTNEEDILKEDPPKKDPPRKGFSKKYPTNEEDPPKKDPPKEDPPKEDPPKKDPQKEDPTNEEDPPKEDPPKEDPLKEDPKYIVTKDDINIIKKALDSGLKGQKTIKENCFRDSKITINQIKYQLSLIRNNIDDIKETEKLGEADLELIKQGFELKMNRDLIMKTYFPNNRKISPNQITHQLKKLIFGVDPNKPLEKLTEEDKDIIKMARDLGKGRLKIKARYFAERNISIGQIDKYIQKIKFPFDPKNPEKFTKEDIEKIKDAHYDEMGPVEIKEKFFLKRNISTTQIEREILRVRFPVDPNKLEKFTKEDIEKITDAHFDGKGAVSIKKELFLERNISTKQIQFMKDKIQFPVDPNKLEKFTTEDIKRLIEAYSNGKGSKLIKQELFLKRNISISQIDHQIREFNYGVDPNKLERLNEQDIEKIKEAHSKGKGSKWIKKEYFLQRNISISQIEYKLVEIRFPVDHNKLEEFNEEDLKNIREAHSIGLGYVAIKSEYFSKRNISIAQIDYQIRMLNFPVDPNNLEKFNEEDIEKIRDAHSKGMGAINIKKELFLNRNINIGQIGIEILRIRFPVDLNNLEKFNEEDIEKIRGAICVGMGAVEIKEQFFLKRNISLGQINYQIEMIKGVCLARGCKSSKLHTPQDFSDKNFCDLHWIEVKKKSRCVNCWAERKDDINNNLCIHCNIKYFCRKEIESTLTNEEVIEIVCKKCTTCGSTDNVFWDRLMSNGIYEKDNTQPLCTDCNRFKWILKPQVFFYMVFLQRKCIGGQTYEQFEQKATMSMKDHKSWRCFYCERFCFTVGELGIDRIFPGSKGGEYIDGNTVHCCPTCNYMKGKSTLREFFDLVTKIYTYCEEECVEQAGLNWSSNAYPCRKDSHYLENI